MVQRPGLFWNQQCLKITENTPSIFQVYPSSIAEQYDNLAPHQVNRTGDKPCLKPNIMKAIFKFDSCLLLRGAESSPGILQTKRTDDGHPFGKYPV
jgi:hypothetical protein